MKKLKKDLQTLSVKDRRSILYVLLALDVALILLGEFAYLLLGILGILTVLLTVVFVRLAFRCPHCDTYLGERMAGYSHCPKCGESIEK